MDADPPDLLPALGAPAPDLELPDTHGTPVRLSALRGAPALVVFVPFAFTRVCTGELAALQDACGGAADDGGASDGGVGALGRVSEPGAAAGPRSGSGSGLASAATLPARDGARSATTLDGARVLAVSCDPVFTLRAWAEQEAFGFDLLSDFWPHGAAARAYGVFDPATGHARRGTFLVDADGVLRWSVLSPGGAPRDVADYRAAIAAL
ncbi:redoxin domain-containing protein [Georgenia sp. MJ206]|uniref:redoxin domain-containing protein n=1 Tax=Georgenia wangjunii TaxID=3117730 RepID=UPI002F26B1E2